MQRLLIVIYTFVADNTWMFPVLGGRGIKLLLWCYCSTYAFNIVFQSYDFFVIFCAFLDNACCSIGYIFGFLLVFFVGHMVKVCTRVSIRTERKNELREKWWKKRQTSGEKKRREIKSRNLGKRMSERGRVTETERQRERQRQREKRKEILLMSWSCYRYTSRPNI